MADPDHWVGSEDPTSWVVDCRRSRDAGSLSAYRSKIPFSNWHIPPSHQAPCRLYVDLLATCPASLPSATKTLEYEPMSGGIAEGAVPLKKIGLRLDTLPAVVVARHREG